MVTSRKYSPSEMIPSAFQAVPALGCAAVGAWVGTVVGCGTDVADAACVGAAVAGSAVAVGLAGSGMGCLGTGVAVSAAGLVVVAGMGVGDVLQAAKITNADNVAKSHCTIFIFLPLKC